MNDIGYQSICKLQRAVQWVKCCADPGQDSVSIACYRYYELYVTPRHIKYITPCQINIISISQIPQCTCPIIPLWNRNMGVLPNIVYCEIWDRCIIKSYNRDIRLNLNIKSTCTNTKLPTRSLETYKYRCRPTHAYTCMLTLRKWLMSLPNIQNIKLFENNLLYLKKKLLEIRYITGVRTQTDR